MGLAFNPCFDGFMGKDSPAGSVFGAVALCFNPCFDGFMDKCRDKECKDFEMEEVSTLVLMDSWINALIT